MESLSSKVLVPSIPTQFPATYSMKPFQIKTLGTNFRNSSLIINSKKSNYQDFQDYVKPSRLLQATEVKVCTDASVEPTKYESLYKVKLQTSKLYGSSLTDMNSGILLCLIDENGSSILQRLPSTSNGTDKWSEDKPVSDTLHFQRGFIDVFAFEGPRLGKIVAAWISLESGQWRVGGINLTVIYHSQLSSGENNQENKQRVGVQYNFEVDDILLGEKSETSMIEFRPYSVTESSDDEFTSFNEKTLTGSNEESMKEYADLKFSLLFYDSILILSGSMIASLVTEEKSASYAFLMGGMFGFLYLLLLQKSVDGLPAEELIQSEGKGIFGRIFGRLKGPISILVLAFVFAIVMVNYGSREDDAKLTPIDFVFGMMGFLMCKVSVVWAAFKPIPFRLRGGK
ncbi:hypothetical protein ACJIZ3_017682 [Penstemon smallii]|uniref:DUF7755 domain-containing protein n=1 Tax=Penstemon smallii TaxID=265156 RepID=A0ABD3SX11_9LAMI